MGAERSRPIPVVRIIIRTICEIRAAYGGVKTEFTPWLYGSDNAVSLESPRSGIQIVTADYFIEESALRLLRPDLGSRASPECGAYIPRDQRGQTYLKTAAPSQAKSRADVERALQANHARLSSRWPSRLLKTAVPPLNFHQFILCERGGDCLETVQANRIETAIYIGAVRKSRGWPHIAPHRYRSLSRLTGDKVHQKAFSRNCRLDRL